MRNRWRVFVICLVMVAAFVLEPVSYVQAGRASDSNYDGVPRVIMSEVLFKELDIFDWFGLKATPSETIYDSFVFTMRLPQGLDASLYDLYFDFELNSDVGNSYEKTSFLYKYDFELGSLNDGYDNDVFMLNVDGDQMTFTFGYDELIQHAEHLETRVSEGYNTYNTVISAVDVYYVRKSDEAAGDIIRYSFSWDQYFWSPKCLKIEYQWIQAEDAPSIILQTSDYNNGVIGFSTVSDSYLNIGEENILKVLSSFIIGLPLAAVSFVQGIYGLVTDLSNLIGVVFPFIPVFIIKVFVVAICIYVVYRIWRFVKGLI